MRAMVRDVEAIMLSLDQVLIAREFLNVFLEELTRIPPDRETEFFIDLAPDVQPVSIAHYRMALAELGLGEFVSHCLVCQQIKAKHQRPIGLLQQIKVPE